jgi:metal-responsive CopG/Arc/MetJ family transcriptional regulator
VKTAISIPDTIFEDAERLAKRRGWSRSELYAHAVSDFVKAQRFLGVRERLDAVYGKHSEDSTFDPLLDQMQSQSLPKEEW